MITLTLILSLNSGSSEYMLWQNSVGFTYADQYVGSGAANRKDGGCVRRQGYGTIGSLN
jgi:hypothetical protein